MDFDFITDNMAVGTWPQNLADVQQLREFGITHVLNVREIDDIPEVKSAFTYLWNPTADWTPEAAIGKEPKPVNWFRASIDFWNPDEWFGWRKRLYCHCSAGVNRSATTAWMFLRAMHLKAADCSWILDHNRPWAALGEVFDRTWRSDAQSALIEMGYIPPVSNTRVQEMMTDRPGNWGKQNNQLLKEILEIVQKIENQLTDVKSLGMKFDKPTNQ